MNKGLPASLKEAFPNIITSEMTVVKDGGIPDPN